MRVTTNAGAGAPAYRREGRAVVMLTVGAAIVHLAIGWMEEGHFSWIASGHGSAIGVFLLWIIVLLSALASLWSSGFRSRPMMGCVAIAVAGVALIR